MDFGLGKTREVKARHLNAGEPDTIAIAAEMLRDGHLVVFPTDTLYGVGADAFNGEAIARLYRVKGRPQQKGIPVLLADSSDLDRVVSDVPDIAARLLAHYWPGPLTLILPKHSSLPPIVSPNEGVAVRIPDNLVARSLIRAAGGALATSSANRSGHTPAQTAAQAMQALGGQVSAVVDDGVTTAGLASTIVDCLSNPPRILRKGPISSEELVKAGALLMT